MKKIRILLFAALIAVSVACVAVVAYFAFAGHREAEKLAEATEAFRKENYAAANPLLREIVRKDPSNAEAFRMLGAINESKQNYPAALADYRQARSLSPLDPVLKSKYLEMLSAAGDFQTLLNTFRSEFNQNRLSPDETFYYLEAMVAADRDLAAVRKAVDNWKETGPRRTYLEGFLDYRQDRAAEALKKFRQVPKDALPTPLYSRYLTMLGAVLQVTGDTAAAEETFRQLAKNTPEIGNFLLARFYMATGREKEYREQLARTVKEFPMHFSALLELAELYTAERNAAALAELKRAPRNRAEVEVYSYLDAMHAFLERRYPEAEKALAVASAFSGRPLYQAIRLLCLISAKNTAKIPECVEALLKTSPSPEARRQILADLQPLLAELVRENKAQDAFKVAASILTVSDEPSPVRTMAEELLLQEAMASGNLIRANGYADELLKNNPDLAIANLAKGDILLSERKPAEALPHYRRLPADNLQGALGEARACAALNRPEEAEKAFSRAHKLAPADLAVFDSYAQFLIAQKRGGEIPALAKSLPATPQTRYLVAYLLGMNADAERKTEEAKKYYLEAVAELEQMPSTPTGEYQRAYLYAVTGQDAKAEPLYEKLLVGNPQQLLILVNLSEVKAALGKKREAMELAERAIKLAPESEMAKQCLRRRQIDLQR